MRTVIALGSSVGFLAGLFDGLRASASTDSSFARAWFTVALMGAVGASIGAVGFLIAGRIARLGSSRARSSAARPRLAQPIDLLALALVLTLVGLLAQRGLASVLPQAGELWRASFGALAAGLVAALIVRWSQQLSPLLLRGLAVAGLLGLALPEMAVQASEGDALMDSVHVRGGDATGSARPRDMATGAAASKPNILLIVLDTVRADHLSLFGYPRPTTPFLEQLAQESTVYSNAIAPAPWTLPSHASLFTGLAPSVHGTSTEHRLLSSGLTTLAELLADDGYATAAFSCNSVVSSGHNFHQGFRDFFEVFRLVAFGRNAGGPPGDDPLDRSLVGKLLRRLRPASEELPAGDKGARLVNRFVPAWLDAWRESPQRRPYFVFVNYIDPHLPYGAPEPYGRRFLDGPLAPELDGLLDWRWLSALMRMIGTWRDQPPEAYRQLVDLYDGELAYQDAMLAELIDSIRSRGLLDDTVVAVVSDHGENLGEHNGLLDHTLSIHQTVLKVPLLIRYPALFRPGLRIETPVSTTGLFASLLEAAGISADLDPAPEPALPRSPGETPAEFVVSEYGLPVFELGQLAGDVPGFSITPYAVRQRAIQTADWKLIQPYPGIASLYDLTRDPQEQNPLSLEGHPEAAELLKGLHAWIAKRSAQAIPLDDEIQELDEATRQALESLGYAR